MRLAPEEMPESRKRLGNKTFLGRNSMAQRGFPLTPRTEKTRGRAEERVQDQR